MKKNSYLTKTFKFLIILFLFAFFFVRPVFDPDLGWHLMTGKYITQTHSIPQTDIFTFSMPNYPYVYHSWLTEYLLYQSYSSLGLWGVTLFYSLIGAIGTYFLLKITQLKLPTAKYQQLIFYYLLTIPIIISITNLRTQLITFTFLSFLYLLISNLQTFKKKIIFIPLLFIFWSNLHGGFILGFIFLTVFILIHLSPHLLKQLLPKQSKKLQPAFSLSKIIQLTIITIISSLTAMINPYTYRIYQQAYRMGTNQFSRYFNTDWQSILEPGSLFFSLNITLFIITLILITNKNKITYIQKLLLTIFLTLSIYTKRYEIIFLIILIPSIAVFLNSYHYSFKDKLKTIHPFNKLIFPLLIVSLIAPSLIWIINTSHAYSNPQSYAQTINQNQYAQVKMPYQAIQYLKQHPLHGHTLNDFNWGGYLYWQLPEYQGFIDGRMDNFFVNGESFAKQYLDIVMLNSNWQKLLQQYRIQNIFISTKYPLTQALSISPNWQLIYQDSIAVIYTNISKQAPTPPQKLPLDF